VPSALLTWNFTGTVLARLENAGGQADLVSGVVPSTRTLWTIRSQGRKP
jgi:hypothetical protein